MDILTRLVGRAGMVAGPCLVPCLRAGAGASRASDRAPLALHAVLRLSTRGAAWRARRSHPLRFLPANDLSFGEPLKISHHSSRFRVCLFPIKTHFSSNPFNKVPGKRQTNVHESAEKRKGLVRTGRSLGELCWPYCAITRQFCALSRSGVGQGGKATLATAPPRRKSLPANAARASKESYFSD